jgi:hypothetical protein
MTIRKLLSATAVFIAQLSLIPLASAQMTRINVGYSAISADQLPAWVAKDSGIFC